MTRLAVAAAVSAVLAVRLVQAAGGAPVSDLTITKTDTELTYTAGDSVTYTIVVGNVGPDAALDATVSDPVASLPQVGAASWTCVAAGGATCTAGPIAGNIADTVDLPVGGTATFTLVVTTFTNATGNLVNTATVAAPTGTTDPVPANNSATDTDLPATIYFVAPTGTDSPTCGPSIACKTIQAAIDNASAGDTVIVGIGTYNECPAAAVPLRIESTEFRSAGTNVGTIIDGTGVCDPESDFAPAVTIAGGSMVRGFTIKGGGDSGVFALGAVSITNNRITGNASTANGGGVRVSMGANVGSAVARTTIALNTIDTNKSAGSGAGIFVNALGSGMPSVVDINGNTVRGNTAGDGTAGVMGGGIAVMSDTATAGDVSDVSIFSNIVDGNVASSAVGGATLGFGGGVFVATGSITGAGTETVRIGTAGRANSIRNNVSEGFGGGVSIVARPAPSAAHTVDIEANNVSANTGQVGGGGLYVVLAAVDHTVGPEPDAIVRVTDNAIAGNHAQAAIDPSVPTPVTIGGGLYAELDSDRTAAGAITFEISGNTIETNDAGHGGGVSLLASADDDPQNNGATAPAEAVISFHHNLVAKNLARDPSAGGASGGGVHAVAVARGSQASAEIVLDFLTVAANETEVGAGGIELEDARPANSLGSTGTTAFSLSNSIVVENQGFGVGGTVLPSASTTVSVAYTDAFGNFSGNYEAHLGVVVGSNGNIPVDPELDAFFLPQRCGPTVDMGDPAIDPADEPAPNGGRVNLGHLGSTADATTTFPDVNGDGIVDGLDVLGIAVAFGAGSADPRYFAAADRDLNLVVDGEDLAFVSAFYAKSCP